MALSLIISMTNKFYLNCEQSAVVMPFEKQVVFMWTFQFFFVLTLFKIGLSEAAHG